MDQQNPQSPQPINPAPAPNNSPESAQASQVAFDSKNIYPQAHTKQFSPGVATSEKTPKVPDSKRTELIKTFVIIIGALITIPQILNLLGLTTLLTFGTVNIAVGISTFFEVIYLLVGIGIMLRRELARIIYVVVGSIFILLSFYWVVHYINLDRPYRNSAVKQTASLQNELDTYEKNATANKTTNSSFYLENVATLQERISEEKGIESDYALNAHFYISLILSYSFSIIPIAFLTRPSVKYVFS